MATTKSKQTTSNTSIAKAVSDLLPDCTQSYLSSLSVEIIDEDLDRKGSSTTVYAAKAKNLFTFPYPRIRKIDASTGIETLLIEGTDYSINHTEGEITFGSAPSGVIRADYFYHPLDDTVLTNLLEKSVAEIATLIYRRIDLQNIPGEYTAVICKRLYSNVLKNLMIETKDYFAVAVAGRSISKDQVPSHFDLLIKDNEAQLMQEINSLRNFNTTNRLE
jgi:hypothetical protein